MSDRFAPESVIDFDRNTHVDDAKVLAALNRMATRGRDMTPLMRDIGEGLLVSTRARFEKGNQHAPDGTPWAPISEDWNRKKQRLRRGANRILTFRGHLRSTLTYQAGRDQVEIGSPRVYAATHQFGAARGAFGRTGRGTPIPFSDIPARPFLGISRGDEADIVAAVNDFVAR